MQFFLVCLDCLRVCLLQGERMKAVAKTNKIEVVPVMLDEIRNHHIDIMPLIIEEVYEILPQLIESVVKNVYCRVEEVG